MAVTPKKTTKKKALGKGLSALFEEVSDIKEEIRENKSEEIKEIKIKDIVPNKEQVRKDFDAEAIKELSQSIKNHGLLEPILLTPIKKGEDKGKYLIVAGERRYRAMLLLKKESIPSVIRDFNLEDVKKLSLIENIQRENLNPVEEALSYKELMAETGMTQEEFSKEIGKSRSHVSNSIRLLNLHKDVLKLVREGKISFGHGKILSSLPMDRQLKLANKILEFGLSVRETETASKSNSYKKSPYVKELEEKLRDKLMTKVHVKDKKGKGKIEIEYFSLDELDRLIDIFQSL